MIFFSDIFIATNPILSSGGPNRTGLTGFTGPVRYPVRFGPVRYFPQIPNRTFLMKCVPKWYLRLDFTFKSSKVAIFFGQISEISFQSHLIFIIQSFRNFEAGYIWKFICYEVRFGKVRFGSVKITGPVRFGKSGICLVRSTTDENTSQLMQSVTLIWIFLLINIPLWEFQNIFPCSVPYHI